MSQRDLSKDENRVVNDAVKMIHDTHRTASGPKLLMTCLHSDVITFSRDHGYQLDAFAFAVLIACFSRGLQEEAIEAMLEVIAEDERDGTSESNPTMADFLKGTTITALSVMPNIDPSRN